MVLDPTLMAMLATVGEKEAMDQWPMPHLVLDVGDFGAIVGTSNRRGPTKRAFFSFLKLKMQK